MVADPLTEWSEFSAACYHSVGVVLEGKGDPNRSSSTITKYENDTYGNDKPQPDNR
jgi:hypothetical protein